MFLRVHLLFALLLQGCAVDAVTPKHLNLSNNRRRRRTQSTCSDTENEIKIQVLTDNFGSDTSWTLRDSTDNSVIHTSDQGVLKSNLYHTESLCLPDGCYSFEIRDAFGDGICCGNGNGHYAAYEGNDDIVLFKGGDFADRKVHQFCLGDSGGNPSPTVTPSLPPTYVGCGGGDNDYKTIELAVAFESSFCAAHGGTMDAAEAEVSRIVSSVSSKFEQDGLCTRVELVYTEGYCDPNTDPYRAMVLANGDTGTCDGLRDDFGSFWNTQRTTVDRDVAHLFTGTRFSCTGSGCTTGCSHLASLCGTQAYAVDFVTFTEDPVARDVLVAHELGHNAGGDHDDAKFGSIMYDYIDSANQHFGSLSITRMLNHMNQVSCVGGEGPADTLAPSSVPSSVPTPRPATWNLISMDDFEDGWGNFETGGVDAKRWSKGGGKTKEGMGSLFIRDNSGRKSSFLSNTDIDVSAYTKVRVTFWYKVFRFKGGEDFFLEFKQSDKRGWNPIQTYAFKTDFLRLKKWYQSVEEFDTSSLDSLKLRFRCDASSNLDKVFIDNVKIEGQG